MSQSSRVGGASVRQLANLLARSEDQVLEDAIRLAGASAAERGWLSAKAVSAVLAGLEGQRPLVDAKPLILQAFRQARESEKSEWSSMAIPVLKNRLLALSARTFDERDYGSPNIWHFVTRFPDLMETEGDRPHERVMLRSELSTELDTAPPPGDLDPVGRGKIRADLWRAIYDYSAGQRFVWDEAAGRARKKTERDLTLPIIPTISKQQLQTLREEFVELQRDVSERDSVRLREWAAGVGATAALPPFYRPLWNAQLKSHAADRLRSFFIVEGLDVPANLIEQPAHTHQRVPATSDARKLAHIYIDAMTSEELSRLSIELAVVMRVATSGV